MADRADASRGEDGPDFLPPAKPGFLMVQLDLFERARLVSRWPGDGPFAFEWWREEPSPPIGKWFDGVGTCQVALAFCERCQVWHPLNVVSGEDRYELASYRCQFSPKGGDLNNDEVIVWHK